jgi:hypothetical protein
MEGKGRKGGNEWLKIRGGKGGRGRIEKESSTK